MTDAYDITWAAGSTVGGRRKNKWDATVAPTAADDSADGFEIGSLWVDVNNDDVYMCVNDTAAAAVWRHLNAGVSDHGGLTGLGDDDHPQYIKDSEFTATGDVLVGTGAGTFVARQNNDNASTAPTASDDNTAGYAIGSRWLDTTNDKEYVATDVSTGAATWVDLTTGAGGGAPTDADYLVGTANGSLSAEIVVGTTPGGELGGTWASPTVDSVHSGSAHHSQSHVLDGGDHTVSGLTPGHVLTALTASTFGFAAAPAGTPASTVTDETTFGISPAVGTDSEYARQDHTHGSPTNPVTAHEAAGDPHPGYLTPAEGNAAYEPLGAVSTHEGLSDPHTGYRLESADHSHASTGLEGGLVSHDVLTNVSADDHHNQAHAFDGADHTGLTITSLATGDLLRYSGTAWVNYPDSNYAASGHTHAYAPDDADYLVGTANGGLSAEIVVGTAPGGELGGTWASPTVDTTHAGSAHHSESHVVNSTGPHAESGLTIGHVLRASAADAFSFAALQASDIPALDYAPSDVDYLVGTASGGLSAEIVVGTAPGGELGGTWASPTVDSVHSGSAHHAQSHVLATGTALGPDHTISGAAAGEVLRALSATTAAFDVLQHGDLGGVGTDDHHSQSHDHSAAGDGTTLSPATLNLPSTTTPAQTTEGQVVWDSDGDFLTVGDGTGRKDFGYLGTTNPVTQNYSDAAAPGSSVEVARIDHVHGMPAAGSGAPDDADYLVGTSNAGLSAEIVVGTTPGGELGGTWASPTVDSVHSGSAHHAQSHDHSSASDGSTLDPAILLLPPGPLLTSGTNGQLLNDGTGVLTLADGSLSGGYKHYPFLNSTPSTQAFGDSADAGTPATAGFASADHKHAFPAQSAIDHGSITGLGDDDHTQYLLVSGTRAMSGNLDVGGNSIISSSGFPALGEWGLDAGHGWSVYASYISQQFGSAAPAVGPYMDAYRYGASGVVAPSDARIWQVEGYVYDGTSSLDTATIIFRVDGAIATDDAPTDIIFATGIGVGGAGGDGWDERWRIASDGDLEPMSDSAYDIGTSAIRVATGYADIWDGAQVHTPHLTQVVVSDTLFPLFEARSADAGPGAKDDNDVLFRHDIYGHDGTGYIIGAQMTARVDGTVGTNVMPSEMVFGINTGGAAISEEVTFRPDSTGWADATIAPGVNYGVSLGDATHQWGQAWLYEGQIGELYVSAISEFRSNLDVYKQADFGTGALQFYRARDNAGSEELVQNNDTLASIYMAGYDGDQYLGAAEIRADVDGTAADNVMYGELIFSTNNGGTAATDRWRISAAGNLEPMLAFTTVGAWDEPVGDFYAEYTYTLRSAFGASIEYYQTADNVDNDFLGFLSMHGQTTGGGFSQGALIFTRVDGTVSAGVLPTEIVFSNNLGSGTSATNIWRFAPSGAFEPMADSLYNIGTASVRPATIYADNLNSAGDITIGADVITEAEWTDLTDGGETTLHTHPGGGSGAPVGADYLVGTADGTLTNEIVVGTSPGGELGGTWASPTIDTTHSGSSHANIPTQTGALNMGTNDITGVGDITMVGDIDGEGFGPYFHHPTTRVGITLERESTVVADGEVGNLLFYGNGWPMGAIRGYARVNAPASGDSPGALVFETTPDGSSTSVQRWQIDHTGAWLPITDSTVDIGSSSVRVATGYFDNLNSAGDITIGAQTISAADWLDLTDGGATTLHSHAGGGGAPTTVDYLVGTADGTLSNEIVVGTTPNGELGGTWGAITVDATHSGSSHAALPTQTATLDMGGNDIISDGVTAGALGEWGTDTGHSWAVYASYISMQGNYAAPGVSPYMDSYRYGTAGATVADDYFLWQVENYGYDGTSSIDGATIFSRIDGTVSTGVLPTEIVFGTSLTNGWVERWRISPAGDFAPITAGAPGAGYAVGEWALPVRDVYVGDFIALRAERDTGPNNIEFYRGRASGTIVADDDILGYIGFYANDGAEGGVMGARIAAVVDEATPANDDVPTELVFSTTNAGTVPTDRWRISPAGALSPIADSTYDIGESSFAGNKHVNALYVDTIYVTDITKDAINGAVDSITVNTLSSSSSSFIDILSASGIYFGTNGVGTTYNYEFLGGNADMRGPSGSELSLYRDDPTTLDTNQLGAIYFGGWDTGSTERRTASIRANAAQDFGLNTNLGTELTFAVTLTGGNTPTDVWQIEADGDLMPLLNATYDIGSFSQKPAAVYGVLGSFTSLDVYETGGGTAGFDFGRTDLTTDAETLAIINFRGSDDGSGVQVGATMYARATEDWTSTAHGTSISFQTTPNGGTSQFTRWRIDQNGALWPFTDSLYDIGLSTNRVNQIYTDGIDTGGNIVPETAGGPSIGAWTNEFNTFYSNYHELAVRDNVSFPQEKLNRTRASSAIVQDGDWLGRILFTGRDTTTQRDAAAIRAAVDGTPGASDMPGELVFSTTPDGSATLTDRWRISAQGHLESATAANYGIYGKPPNVVTYTSGSGNWTKPTNPTPTYIVVEVQGGGGGGGGSQATSTSEAGSGGGGGGGGYARKVYSASDLSGASSFAYAVGSGGGGGSGNTNGSDGSASTFTVGGTALTGSGGGGGTAGAAGVGFTIDSGGGSGAASNGDVNIGGGPGHNGIRVSLPGVSAATAIQGHGGDSQLGGGGRRDPTGGGFGGSGYGSGGAGGWGNQSSAATDGGDGKDGIVIITEFYGP